jgi:hypothetical protein
MTDVGTKKVSSSDAVLDAISCKSQILIMSMMGTTPQIRIFRLILNLPVIES